MSRDGTSQLKMQSLMRTKLQVLVVCTEIVGKIRNRPTVGVIIIDAQPTAYVDMLHKDVTGFELILQFVDTVA